MKIYKTCEIEHAPLRFDLSKKNPKMVFDCIGLNSTISTVRICNVRKIRMYVHKYSMLTYIIYKVRLALIKDNMY